MRSIIGERAAANILLVLLTIALLFQLVVLAGLIPQEMVWGGRLETGQQGTVMALVAIAILVLMMMTVLNRSGRFGAPTSIVGWIGIWLMFVLFLMNTLGNIVALDARERMIFTPLTLILALLCLRLAVKDQEGGMNRGVPE